MARPSPKKAQRYGAAIYEAFDAGECDRGDGQDPIEAYTKPQIRRILEVASRGGMNRD